MALEYWEQLRRPIKSFKTGSGLCFLCMKNFAVLERHHELYQPERCVFLCHGCHFKIHFQRFNLSHTEKEKLLSARYDTPLDIAAKNKEKTTWDFIDAYAPPTRPRSFPKQHTEKLLD